MAERVDLGRGFAPDWTNILAALPLFCALAVLGLGWGLGQEIAVRLAPGLPAMVPRTAFAILFASIATLAAINRWPTPVIVVASLGLLAMIASHFIAKGFAPADGNGDFMALGTSFCLVCLGISVTAIRAPFRGAWAVAMVAGGLCAVASGTALMAHALSFDSVRGVLGFKEMAVHTAGSIFLLNTALILSSRDSAHFRGLLGTSRESVILRISLVLSIALVLAVCAATRVLTHWAWITPDFRLVFLCSAMITLLVASALMTGYQIDQIEGEKARMSAIQSATDRALQSIELNKERDENLRILGQIVAGVAHDFNNALTALRGNLELMQVDPDGSGNYLSEAIRAADRAAGLTSQLLESGRQSRLQIGEGDVVAVARQVMDLFQRVAPSNISIRLDADDVGLGTVRVDDATLERALLNLLVNARDAMPTGGTLRITISQRMITNGYAATFNFNAGLSPGEYLVIEVADTGTGMDDATIAKAVQPYFTTKGVGKGSGLGLASVNGICQQQGGGLLIRSAPGAGTSVIIALPVAEARQSGETEQDDFDADIPFDILLITNSARRHQDFLHFLHRQGRVVRHVRGEQEAFELLETARLPSVVLIDEGMFAGVRGTELKADIKARFPGLPVVYVGDYGEGGFGMAMDESGEGPRACA